MITFERLLQLLLGSGLVSESTLTSIVAEFQRKGAATEGSQTAANLMELLVSKGLLTQWQCTELAKGREVCFLFQHKYNLLDRLPRGRYHYGFRGQCIATSSKIDVIFIPYRRQTTVAIIQADQLVETLVLWLGRFHDKFFSLGRYAKCSAIVGGKHNSTSCYVREIETDDLLFALFIPTAESVSVYVTRPGKLIEFGVANWTPAPDAAERV